MTYLIGILTFILFLDCLLLTLLILVQLPKKEAGMGQAFGGGATDALFGAGAGNALTKLTKWAAGIFMGLALLLSMLNIAVNKKAPSGRDAFTDNAPTPSAVVSNAPAAPAPPVVPAAPNNVISAIPTGNNATNATTNMLTTTTIVTNAANTNLSNLTNAVKTNAAPLLNATQTNAGNLLQTITATAKSGLNTVSNTAVKAVEDVKKEIPKADDKK